MKLLVITVAVLLGGTRATFLQSDILAAEGLTKLGLHVAENGYPNAKHCTLKDVAVRREWYSQLIQYKTTPAYSHMIGQRYVDLRSSTTSELSNALDPSPRKLQQLLLLVPRAATMIL